MKALLLCLGVLVAAEFAVAEPAPQTHIGRYNILDADIHYRNPNTGVALSQSETRELVIRLYNTRAVNHADIVEQLALQSDVNRGEGFASANPYYPRAEEVSIALPKPRSVVRDGKRFTTRRVTLILLKATSWKMAVPITSSNSASASGSAT